MSTREVGWNNERWWSPIYVYKTQLQSFFKTCHGMNKIIYTKKYIEIRDWWKYPLWHKLLLTGQTDDRVGPENQPSNKQHIALREELQSVNYWIQNGARLNIWCNYNVYKFLSIGYWYAEPMLKKTKHVKHLCVQTFKVKETTGARIIRKIVDIYIFNAIHSTRYMGWCAAGCLSKS